LSTDEFFTAEEKAGNMLNSAAEFNNKETEFNNFAALFNDKETQFKDFVETESAKFAGVIERAKIKLEN